MIVGELRQPEFIIDKQTGRVILPPFKFKNEYMTFIDWRWNDDDTFTFRFGEDELRDNYGYDCYMVCEYHRDANRYIIEMWRHFEDYGDSLILFDSYYSDIAKSCEDFSLSNNDINNIISYMKRLISITGSKSN